MEIKEQDSQRMVISPTFLEQLSPICTKVVIDKLTQTITVERRYFWLINRKHVIPFSRVGVGSITVERRTVATMPESGVNYYFWKVLLIYGVPRVGVKKLIIAGSRNEEEMRRLADKIGRFIGK